MLTLQITSRIFVQSSFNSVFFRWEKTTEIISHPTYCVSSYSKKRNILVLRGMLSSTVKFIFWRTIHIIKRNKPVYNLNYPSSRYLWFSLGFLNIILSAQDNLMQENYLIAKQPRSKFSVLYRHRYTDTRGGREGHENEVQHNHWVV